MKKRYITNFEVPIPYVSKDERKILKQGLNGAAYGRDILNFIAVLEQIPEIDLNIFFHNLRSLKVCRSDPWFSTYKARNCGNVKAAYCAKTNKIYIDDLSNDIDLYHELLHSASTLVDYEKDEILCGLSQRTRYGRINIGTVLNEGYTNLLVSRYFERDNLYYNLINETIADIIEEVVGRELMLKSYFTADLGPIINELAKYAPKEQILRFLENSKSIKTYKLCSRDSHLLFSIYLKKMIEKWINGKLSSDEYITKLVNYFYNLGIDYFDEYCKGMIGTNLSIQVLAQIKQRSEENRKTFIKHIAMNFQNR